MGQNWLTVDSCPMADDYFKVLIVKFVENETFRSLATNKK